MDNRNSKLKQLVPRLTDATSPGLMQSILGIYEFASAWQGSQMSYTVIAGVRLLSYAVTNEVWKWGLGWPLLDSELVVAIVAVAAALG